MIRRLMVLCIRGYQKFISPYLGDNCRFYPTCSQYAIEALEVHGVIKGSILAAIEPVASTVLAHPALQLARQTRF